MQSVYSQGAVPAVVATEADRISALEKQIKDLQVELQKLRTQPAATEEQERQWRDLLKNSSGMKLNFYGEGNAPRDPHASTASDLPEGSMRAEFVTSIYFRPQAIASNGSIK